MTTTEPERPDREAYNRQWWYLYEQVLRMPTVRSKVERELCAWTALGEKWGYVLPGVPADRKGAEDLANKCDRLRGYKRR